MSTDDITGGGWGLTADTRRALRLAAARRAVRQRDWRQAVVEAEELLDESPADVDGLWTLAEAAMELRDHEVALEAWRALVAAGVDRVPVWTQLGVCAFETCAFAEAAEAARRALALFQDAGDAAFLLGLCTERLEGPEAAWPWFEQAHRTNPLGFPLPLDLAEADVHELVSEALADLPPDLASFWVGVPLRVDDLPAPDDLTEQVPPITPRVLALYAGEAPAAPTGEERPPLLRVYRLNLAHHDSPEHAIGQLADALEQEALDWLPPAGEE